MHVVWNTTRSTAVVTPGAHQGLGRTYFEGKKEFADRQRQMAKKGQTRVLSPEEGAKKDAIQEEEAKRPKAEVPLTESALENMLQSNTKALFCFTCFV